MTVFVTFAQGGADPSAWTVAFEKTQDDIEIQQTKLIVPLTQADTLALSARKPVYVQIRAIDSDGLAVASNIMTTSVGAIIKDGEIEYDA